MSENPLTLKAFLRFAKKQNSRKKFDYADASKCACAQYAKSLGLYEMWQLDFPRTATFWHDANQSAACASGSQRKVTWGDLVWQLESELA
jgi:hypothetical protein